MPVLPKYVVLKAPSSMRKGNRVHQTFTFRGTLAVQEMLHARSARWRTPNAWLCALRALNCVWHPGQGQCQQGWKIGQHKGSPAAMSNDDKVAKKRMHKTKDVHLNRPIIL